MPELLDSQCVNGEKITNASAYVPMYVYVKVCYGMIKNVWESGKPEWEINEIRKG